MADNTETYIIRLRDDGVISGFRAADAAGAQVQARVSGIGTAFKSLGGIIAGISIAALGHSVVDTLAKFERFDAVLTNTLGSQSAAQKSMAMITDFAAKTPFEVDGLTDSFVKLANQGFVPTMAEMTKLGDLASSKGKDMNMLTEALIDAQVGEFERLKEFGIRAKKEGDKVTFTFKGQQKQVAFTEDSIKSYILSLGDLQGVSGAMAAIAGTTGGQISNLGDTVTSLYLKLGTKLKPAISGVISGLSSLVGWIGQFSDWVTSGSTGAEVFTGVVVLLAGALAAYGLIQGYLATSTAAVTAAQWLWNVAMTANPIGVIIVAVGALIAFIGWLAYKTEGWGAAWQHTWSGVKAIFGASMSFLKLGWLSYQEIIMTGIDAIMIAWYKLKGLWNEEEGDAGLAAIQAESDRRKEAIKNTGKEVVEGFKKGADEFRKAGQSIKWKEGDPAKEADAGAVNPLGKQGAGAGAAKSGIGAGISEIRSSAPKNFYISIGSLVEKFEVKTTNLTEGASKVKEEITKALLTSVNDMQIISE